MWEYTWIIITNSLLDVACFSWSILLIASTKHLKCFSDHHFHISHPSTTLSLPTHRRQAPTQGRTDLSPKNHSWYSLEITWLIDPSDGLNLMSNLEFFFKSFSFYLFKSFFLLNDLQWSLELKLHLHLELGLDLQFEYQICVPSTLHNQMALYSLLVMLLAYLKTKLRCINHLESCFQLEDLSIKVTLNQSNNYYFSSRFYTLQRKIYISQHMDLKATKFGGDVLHYVF
jgi:hypothetical protein